MSRRFGGAELDPLAQLDVVEAISVADGSAGWCAMIGSDGGYATSHLELDVVRDDVSVVRHPDRARGGTDRARRRSPRRLHGQRALGVRERVHPRRVDLRELPRGPRRRNADRAGRASTDARHGRAGGCDRRRRYVADHRSRRERQPRRRGRERVRSRRTHLLAVRQRSGRRIAVVSPPLGLLRQHRQPFLSASRAPRSTRRSRLPRPRCRCRPSNHCARR